MRSDDVLILTGPTGVGKTELSLELAARWNAEIISADSRLVYRTLDIGTAKPSTAERAAAPHHLVDVRDPCERFTAADFRDGCLQAIQDIRSRGRLPLIVGGTCMYLHALLHGFDFGGADYDLELRARLQQRAQSEGAAALHAELAGAAPETASRIPPADARRIIRALELIHLTGNPTSKMKRGKDNEPAFPHRARIFILYLPREILYDRINKRVDTMYNSGLVEETEALLRRHGPEVKGFLKSIIGYSQAADLLENRTGRGQAVETTRRETRRFAKRQMTWFRRMNAVVWLNAEGNRRQGLLPLIEQFVKSGPQY